MTTTLARHGAAKPHRAGRCSGCCKLKLSGPLHRESSVLFLSRLAFLRLLLEGVRSACERLRPPRTTRALLALNKLYREQVVRAKRAARRQARVRGPRCPRQPVHHARAAQRVRGLPTAAQHFTALLLRSHVVICIDWSISEDTPIAMTMASSQQSDVSISVKDYSLDAPRLTWSGPGTLVSRLTLIQPLGLIRPRGSATPEVLEHPRADDMIVGLGHRPRAGRDGERHNSGAIDTGQDRVNAPVQSP